MIRNLEAFTGGGGPRMLPVDNTRRSPLVTALNQTLFSVILMAQFIHRETDMRATLSRQKGNIAHKDILLHAHAILSREEKLATP
jgi:hypothetical protein